MDSNQNPILPILRKEADLMDEKFISADAFFSEMQERYCMNCDRRKGMKRGKLRTVYAIGDVPCRACTIMDMLDEVDCFPEADVVEVVRCKDCRDFSAISGINCCEFWNIAGVPEDGFCFMGGRKKE